MSQQDYISGLTGGPASNSPSFKWGEMLRQNREFAQTVKQNMDACRSTAEVPRAQETNYGGQAYGAGNGSTYEPSVFAAWDDHPALAFWTFVVAVAVSITIVSPAIDAVGLPRLAAWFASVVAHNDRFAETADSFPRIMLLGGASLALSLWTKALPITFGAGLLLLFARYMLAG